MQSRFVGNSFLLFEPVFSLYAAFLSSSSLSLPPPGGPGYSLASSSHTREQTFGGSVPRARSVVIDREEELRADSYDLSNGIRQGWFLGFSLDHKLD